MTNVLAFAPAYVERRLSAALDAEDAGDAEAALGEVLAALRVAPREPRAAALAAVYAALLDRPRAALFYSRKAMRRAPVSAEVAYWAGVARHIAGAHIWAIEALEIAVALDPEDRAARALILRCEHAAVG